MLSVQDCLQVVSVGTIAGLAGGLLLCLAGWAVRKTINLFLQV